MPPRDSLGRSLIITIWWDSSFLSLLHPARKSGIELAPYRHPAGRDVRQVMKPPSGGNLIDGVPGLVAETDETGKRAAGKGSTAIAARQLSCGLEEEALLPKIAKTVLSSWETLTLKDQIKIASTLNRASRHLASLSLDRAAFAVMPENLLAALEYYGSRAFHLRPEEFFLSPPPLAEPKFSLPHTFSAGEVVDISFPSAYLPHYQDYTRDFDSCVANRSAFARLWRHTKEESLGTIVAVHGWMMGDKRLSALTLVPGFFFRMGLDVVMYELPYHGQRRCVAGSGPLIFPSANIACTNEGFGQAISDLRRLSGWARSSTGKPVGAIGLSLGGYTAALWSALDELDFVIAAAPLACLATFTWEVLINQPAGLPLRQTVEALGLELATLKGAYSVHSPLSYPSRVRRENRLILAGVDDAVVPASQPELLYHHWEKPQAEWLSGGHLGHLVDPSALARVQDFLHQRGFARDKLISL